jgi:hypothetical protein
MMVLAAIALALGFLATGAVRAQAASCLLGPLPGSCFEAADGDQVDSDGTLGDLLGNRKDWQSVVSSGDFTSVADASNPDTQFGGGSKQEEPDSWEIITGVDPTGKANALAIGSYSETATSKLFLYLALVREKTTGTTDTAFELNQAQPGYRDSNGTPLPTRTTGDVLITFDINGQIVTVGMCRWQGDEHIGQWLMLDGTPVDSTNTHTCTPLAAPLSQGAMNAADIPDSESFLPAYPGDILAGQFGEAAINLTDTFASSNIDPCFDFGSVWMHSRSATSITSQMKDFVAPKPIKVASCGVSGTKWQDHDGDGIRDAGDEGLGGWTIYVDYDGDGVKDANEPSAVTAADGSYTIGHVASGTYPVREVQQTGWVCSSPSPCSHNVSFTNGVVGNRDFGNFERPTITIQKVTLPSGGPSFNFDGTGSIGSFSLADGGSHDSSVVPGSYVITEQASSTYRVASVQCTPTGSGSVVARTASMTVGSGDHVTCTFENHRRPRLTVIKTVVNNNGGTAASTAFTMDVTGTNVSNAHFPGNAAGATVVMDAGSYSVDESGGPSGYAKTLSAGCSGTIADGDDKTCTITNDDIAPKVTVVKTVVNDDGGTASSADFTMDVTGTSVSDPHFAGTAAGKTVTLNSGSYSVDESGGPSGYAKSLSANCAGTIAIGQEKTCTITNNDIAPKLTVVKNVINNNGGTATSSAFTMDVTGTSVSDAHFPGTAAGKTVTLNAGAYSVDESGGPGGYGKSLSAGCSGTIAVGQEKTCTITNDDIAPKLTVVKTVVNNDGGAATAADFTMDVTGTSVSDAHFPGTAAGKTVTLNAGAYSVDESGGPSGYAKALSADCSGTIAIGQEKTCTITNNDIAPKLTVVKNVVNNNGGTASPSDFTMDVTGSGVSDAHFPGTAAGKTVTLNAGSYSVDESGGPSGYAKTLSAGCSGTIAVGQEKTCTITNNDIAATLTVIKTVVNNDGGTATSGDFTMDVTGSGVSDAHFPGTAAGKTVALDAGAYSVDESGGPGGYAKTLSAGCSGTIAVGQAKTCTITNEDIAPKLTVVKTVVNHDGGSATASDFTMDVTGSGVSDAHFPGTAAGKTVTLNAGSYSVDESGGPSGYAKTLSEDCAGSIAIGQEKTCTITNDDIAPRLTVTKTVVGHASPSDFTMDVTGSDVSDAHFPGTDAGKTVTLDAGSYSVDESGGPDGYAKTLSEGCSGSIAIGQEKSCAITNTELARVIVEVQTDPAGGTPSFGFHTDLTGVPTFALTHGHTEQRLVLPGSYSVTEDDPRPHGYKLVSLACTEDGTDDSVVSSGSQLASERRADVHAQPGETIHCIYVNAQVLGGINVVKSGPDHAYPGDTLRFEFAVTNSGNTPLHAIHVSDDRCADVSAAPVRRTNDDGDDLLEKVGTDGSSSEVWVFTCSMAAPAQGATLVNTATAEGLDEYDRPVEDTDAHTTRLLHPAVAIDKTGPARALAGDPVTFTMVVTNPGDESFAQSQVAVTDALCETPPTAPIAKRRGAGADATPGSLDPGDSWVYTCVVQTDVGQTSVHNVANVGARDEFGRIVADSDDATTELDQPTQVASFVSGRAQLHGSGGCRTKPFKVYVNGRQIARVVFSVDGKRVKTVRRATAGRWPVTINPLRYRTGAHRVSARVTFKASSRTSARTLRMTFFRCPAPELPRFTG